MKRKRLLILDEMIESCRLMPAWIQFIFVMIVMGIAVFIIPVATYFFLAAIITIQVIFILLLIQKNIVYKRISKLEVAIQKMVVWVHSKKDEREKYKKAMINVLLIGN